MRRTTAILSLALSLIALGRPAAAASPEKLTRKVITAQEVYRELFEMPDRAVPRNLLEQSRCIAVIPRIYEGAFGFGGRHGRGILTCRNLNGDWSPPSFIELSGGSFGLQIGFEATDMVLFFLTEGSVLSLLESKFTLGGDASVAAGPLGRTAEAATDLKLRAEIYAYAKSKGLFAGISVQGGRLAPDEESNHKYYGQWIHPKAILFDHKVPEVPAEARSFLSRLP